MTKTFHPRRAAAWSGARHGLAVAALAVVALLALSFYVTHVQGEEGLYDDAHDVGTFVWDTGIGLFFFGGPAALVGGGGGALFGLASLPYARQHTPRSTALACAVSAPLLLSIPLVPVWGPAAALLAISPPGVLLGAAMARHGYRLSSRLHEAVPAVVDLTAGEARPLTRV